MRRCLILALAVGAGALVAPAAPAAARSVEMRGLLEPYGSGVDPFAVIGQTLDTAADKELLTKVAKLGLLSKLDRAGLTLRDVEPLLVFAEEQGLVGALGDVNDELLPLLPTLVGLAPLGLPLAKVALNTPPPAFFGLAAASLGAAFVVSSAPDDSVAAVAIQTLIAVPLATLFPVLFGGLGLATSKLQPGALRA